MRPILFLGRKPSTYESAPPRSRSSRNVASGRAYRTHPCKPPYLPERRHLTLTSPAFYHRISLSHPVVHQLVTRTPAASQNAQAAAITPSTSMAILRISERKGSPPNMSRALSRDKFGQTPCFSGPGLIIWPASLPRWTCLDRRASSQSNIRGFAGRAAAASDRRGSPPRALYVAGVASQFVATAGGVTFGLKSLPAGVPREQRPRE